ncbi:MAG: hypothetical protein JW895_00830 [Thermoleophilaceae bacterium]|nr:hypothetical protein [Thermoleophilaceae bacterium]
MSDDLVRQLRDAGYEDEADSIERRGLIGQLREAGRDDLADRLGSREADDGGPASDEDAELTAVVAALDRDVPDWRRR